MFGLFKKKIQMAKQARVEFIRSGKTLNWSTGDGTILQLAKRNNIKTTSSCCKGHCGVCVAPLISGDVFYQTDISFEIKGNAILLCSAYPGAKSASELANLRIDL